MHKSQLGGFIIDCQTEDLQAAAEFWGAALGMAVEAHPSAGGDKYRRLDDRQRQLSIEVQAVDHASRVHLDIETDDVAAEVLRLEKLGARRIAACQDWYVMEAPTGQRFCVVPASTPGFAGQAHTWQA